jgi:DNA-directed RNA polymerase specialized sigma24 family protein
MVLDGSPRRTAVGLAARLERIAPIRRQWRRWSASEPVLAGHSYVEVRAELHDQSGAYERNDEVLAALCRIARNDADAMAIVAALLLPGLRRRACRQRALDREDALSELVGALCRHIVSYDTARRPRYVASNLLQDSTRDLQRSTTKVSAGAVSGWPLVGTDLAAADPGREENVTASLVLESAMRAGIISRSEAALVLLTVFADAGLGDAARALGITYEAAKKRRQRALPRLAKWWRGHTPARSRRGDGTEGARDQARR